MKCLFATAKTPVYFRVKEKGEKKTILVSCGDKALLLLVCFFCLLFFMALLHPLVYALSLLRFFFWGGGLRAAKQKLPLPSVGAS